MYIHFSQRWNSKEKHLRNDLLMICMLIASVIWINVCVVMVTRVEEAGINRVGLGCSLLIQPNCYFVNSMHVEKSSTAETGAIMYGFNKTPPLDVLTTWTDTHYASPQANITNDWIYALNKGSEISIFYSVPSSASMLLTITRGSYISGRWYFDQSSPDRSLSWNIIHGTGVIKKDIQQSSRYQIAVRSLIRSQVAEVQLNMTARAFVYNTTEACYTCMLAQGPCSIPVLFGEENHVVVTTPLKQGVSDDEWNLKVAYEGRMAVFFGGMVLCNLMIFVVIYSFNILLELHKSTDRCAFLRSLRPCIAKNMPNSCCFEESESLLYHDNLI